MIEMMLKMVLNMKQFTNFQMGGGRKETGESRNSQQISFEILDIFSVCSILQVSRSLYIIIIPDEQYMFFSPVYVRCFLTV